MISEDRGSNESDLGSSLSRLLFLHASGVTSAITLAALLSNSYSWRAWIADLIELWTQVTRPLAVLLAEWALWLLPESWRFVLTPIQKDYVAVGVVLAMSALRLFAVFGEGVLNVVSFGHVGAPLIDQSPRAEPSDEGNEDTVGNLLGYLILAGIAALILFYPGGWDIVKSWTLHVLWVIMWFYIYILVGYPIGFVLTWPAWSAVALWWTVSGVAGNPAVSPERRALGALVLLPGAYLLLLIAIDRFMPQ